MEKENFGLRQISRTEKVSMGTFGILGTYGSKNSLSRKTSETELDERRILLKKRNVGDVDQMTICLKFWPN